ncbi:hypothetical protein [Ruegeria conchae]|uniref:hypothetical protein n=1 Tax=Ruegeria conchae TaxID=981384 RepID=UPI0029C831ED|nr:hypothetical protein [Ruegeria conchae]
MLRRLLKILVISFAAVLMALVVFVLVVVEDAPLVEAGAPPSPKDVTEAREFVRGLRSAIQPKLSETASFTTNEDQLNSVLKLGGRFVPGFRGELSVDGKSVYGIASVPVPYTNKWMNLRASVPEFEGPFVLSSVQLGPVTVPPSLAISVARIGGNVIVGEQFGDIVLNVADSMHIHDGNVAFRLTMNEMGSNGLMRGIFGSLRGSDMPDSGDIDRYYLEFRSAMDLGELPTSGSYLPYLLFMLEAAHEGSQSEGVANAYASAIIALTLICGAKDFTLIVGGMVGSEFAEDNNWKADCGELTLNGRIDSRRHFTTAAALQAASNRGFAVSVGEFKELYDTVKSGGFDFTDLAANNSGIRMSNKFMSTPAPDWAELIHGIRSENDVIIGFEDIPQIMSEEEFENTYKDVESIEYLKMLNLIEARIDELELHRRGNRID